MLTLILAALLEGSAADTPQHKAQILCIAEGARDWRCNATGNHARVAPAGFDRPFTKTDPERRIVEFGILPANAEIPRVSQAQSIVLSVLQPDHEEWPAPVTVTLSTTAVVLIRVPCRSIHQMFLQSKEFATTQRSKWRAIVGDPESRFIQPGGSVGVDIFDTRDLLSSIASTVV